MWLPPYVRLGQAADQWDNIGASSWLIRQIKYGIQLPWTREPSSQHTRRIRMTGEDRAFEEEEILRWVALRYARRATRKEARRLRRSGQLSGAFVTSTGGKRRLVIDYRRVNEALQDRTFRMDQLGDLAASLNPGDSLFKADLKDGYYHLRIRQQDQLRLAFELNGVVYLPLALNCGLKVAPWFFTRLLRPVVSHLRKQGHRVFAYFCLLYTSPSPRDKRQTRMPSSA